MQSEFSKGDFVTRAVARTAHYGEDTGEVWEIHILIIFQDRFRLRLHAGKPPNLARIKASAEKLKSLGHLANIYQISIKYLSNVYQISIKYLSNIYQISIKYLSNIYQISIKYLSNIYQISIKYLSNIYQISIKYLSNIYQISIKYLSNIYQISIKYLSNIYQISIKYLSNIYQVSIKYLSNIYQISIKYLSNIYQISIKYLSNIYQISIKYLSNIYQISIKYLSDFLGFWSGEGFSGYGFRIAFCRIPEWFQVTWDVESRSGDFCVPIGLWSEHVRTKGIPRAQESTTWQHQHHKPSENIRSPEEAKC